ncbi:hypothetical protein [Citrobacter sp. MNAZ 1397]|uniref:hypothetical protein n=1 Tax=Citrobacter sp. MNAZ 1397 TaxID=2911205 RepID=UPI0020265AD1|nr:hypothetical protein [Citrobacter sp. MNAZ 1397]MCL9671400.1 hypothetical protein [Citrobacter sp. MNAZ 1397]
MADDLTMTPDAVLIAKAILMLKADVDYVKDYVFPTTLSFFSALLGGVTAYYVNSRQEKIKAESEKCTAANSLMMLSFQMVNTLVAIKANYIGMRSQNPIQRALAINEILFIAGDVVFDIGRISYIKKIPTQNKSTFERLYSFLRYKILKCEVVVPTDEEIGKTWRNLARIDAFLFNYNFVLKTLIIRNQLDSEVRAHLSKVNVLNEPVFELGLEDIVKEIGAGELSKYIDLTENLVALIDFLIKEIDSFINAFPEIAESNIDLSKTKGARLVRIVLNKPAYLASLIPIRKPDYKLTSQLVGMTQEEAEKRYSYSDWY